MTIEEFLQMMGRNGMPGAPGMAAGGMPGMGAPPMPMGRDPSDNIEDRRNDPKGATRFLPPGARVGDLTFHPPLQTTLPYGTPQVLPYRDPEAIFKNMGTLRVTARSQT
jgi:hypothetical protein